MRREVSRHHPAPQDWQLDPHGVRDDPPLARQHKAAALDQQDEWQPGLELGPRFIHRGAVGL